MLVLLHVFLVELLGISGEFLVKMLISGTRRVRHAELGNIDEKLALQRTATNQNWKIIAAAIGKGVADADFFAFDNGRERNEIADGLVASGVADFTNLEIGGRKTLAGIKRALRGEKRKLEVVIIGEADVARPDRGNTSTGVDLRRDVVNTSDLDEGAVADDGERLGRMASFRDHIFLL